MISCTPIAREEIGLLSEWMADESAREFLACDTQASLAGQFRWIGERRNEPFTTHWLIRRNKAPIGVLALVGINLENKRCGWSYYLHDPADDSDELSLLLETKRLSSRIRSIRAQQGHVQRVPGKCVCGAAQDRKRLHTGGRAHRSCADRRKIP